MRRVTLYLLLAIAQLTATACSRSPAAPEPSAPQTALEAAASLVERYNTGQGLRGLAYEAARGTTTYATQVEALGRTLARHGNQSPHAAKFKALQPEVAASMRERSRPLLEAVVTAALSR